MLNLQRALREKMTPLQLVQTPVVAVEHQKRSVAQRIQEAARGLLRSPPASRRRGPNRPASPQSDNDGGSNGQSGDEFDADGRGTGSTGVSGHFTTRYSRRPFFTWF